MHAPSSSASPDLLADTPTDDAGKIGSVWPKHCSIARSPRICGTRRDQVICPAGRFVAALFAVSGFPKAQITSIFSPSRPTEGRVAIVTAAGRDAVDADAPITNGVEADGEDVWS
jgi:hypothetical protein